MIVELNKLYILSAPAAVDGMTPGETNFISSHSDDVTFTSMKKVDQASEEKPIFSMAKIFNYKGKVMQAIVFYDSKYPITKVQKLLNDTVDKYSKNIAEAKKAK